MNILVFMIGSSMSVSFLSDGCALAVGEVLAGRGLVGIFSLKGVKCKHLGQTFDGANGDDQFGISVSISSNTLAVGAAGTISCNECAHSAIYKIDEERALWVEVGQQINKFLEPGASAKQAALSKDSSIVAIGASLTKGGWLVEVHSLLLFGEHLLWAPISKVVHELFQGQLEKRRLCRQS